METNTTLYAPEVADLARDLSTTTEPAAIRHIATALLALARQRHWHAAADPVLARAKETSLTCDQLEALMQPLSDAVPALTCEQTVCLKQIVHAVTTDTKRQRHCHPYFAWVLRKLASDLEITAGVTRQEKR